jgi:hypothetical protein
MASPKETTNNHKFLCIPCRYTARRKWSPDYEHRCPHCQRRLQYVWLTTPIPRKQDAKAWDALAIDRRTFLAKRGTRKVPDKTRKI